MISAQVIKDSTNWLGNRLTTLILVYPRYIHSEFMTHRVLSKNSASSRAIPTAKIVEDVRENTVMPIWTRKAKGMQGEIITDEKLIETLNADWIFSRNFVINEAWALDAAGVHKQNANRILEPFQNIKVICTGTEWSNFFQLRDHKDAMPEIQELSRAIKKAMEDSKPEFLNEAEWHIPFGDKFEDDHLSRVGETPNILIDKRVKISVARCARISYNTFDGEIDYGKDMELYDRLVKSNPKHLSPTEHQARVPMGHELGSFSSTYISKELGKYEYVRGKYISNLQGWIQYRKIIENETHG